MQSELQFKVIIGIWRRRIVIWSLGFIGNTLDHKQYDFMHDYYHYYARMFNLNVINVAREPFDIALCFSYLACNEVKHSMTKFDWLKDENFIFIWVHHQCIHTLYHSSKHALGEYYIFTRNCWKMYFSNMGIDIKYQTLFIDEGQYHS